MMIITKAMVQRMCTVGPIESDGRPDVDERNFHSDARTHLKIEENRLIVINDLRGVSKRDERVFFPIQ